MRRSDGVVVSSTPNAEPRLHGLLVEDSRGDQKLIERFLGKHGISIEVAELAADGAAQLTEGRFAFLLLDLHLPDSQAEKTLATFGPFFHSVPTLVLTTSDSDFTQRALEIGAQDYIDKNGLTAETLERAIDHARGRHELLRRVMEESADLGRPHTEEADAADKLRSVLNHERTNLVAQLAGGVGHEINNPAAAIMTNLTCMEGIVADVRSQLASATGIGPETDQLLDELAGISKEASDGMLRITQIVRSLQTLARDDDESELVEDRLDNVVSGACLLAGIETRRNATLEISLASTNAARMQRSRLTQVVTRLILWAGTGRRRDAHYRVSVTTDTVADGGARLVIHRHIDGGPLSARGNSDARPEADPRYALDELIVHNHGGTLRMTRPAPRELRFEMTLPAVRPSQIPQRNCAPRGRLRLLMIDDDPIVVRSFSRILRRQWELTAVDAAERALSLIREGQDFNVILCDLMMPDMAGWHFYEKLAECAPELRERTIFMSGGAFTPEALSFLADLDDRCFMKSDGIDTLQSMLGAVAAV